MLSCNDDDACNGVETYDPVNGCQAGIPLVCDDGNPCNGVETCDPVNGCQAGTPVVCNDNNPCTNDTCDAASGECISINDPENNGSAEICDGKDNDCDGNIDNGVLSTFYKDADGDGYGDPDISEMACSAPQGYVTDNQDCDDNSFFTNPGNLRIKGSMGEDMADFQMGLNLVTMDTSCTPYDSYTFLQDSIFRNRLSTIHLCSPALQTNNIREVMNTLELTDSAYLFFGKPSGANFTIKNKTPYLVFRWE